jgi:hypothetical protein
MKQILPILKQVMHRKTTVLWTTEATTKQYQIHTEVSFAICIIAQCTAQVTESTIKYGMKLYFELNIVCDHGFKTFRSFYTEIVLSEYNASLRNCAPDAGPEPVTSPVINGRNNRFAVSCFIYWKAAHIFIGSNGCINLTDSIQKTH